MRHVRVALGLEEADDVNGAGRADPREVVSAEVDQHDVLGLVLLGREQALGVTRTGARRPGYRVQRGARALELDQGLRGGADEGDPVQLEQEVVRGRVDAPERAVEGERRRAGLPLRPLREHDLEGVARADVLLRPPDAVLVGLLRGEAPGSSGSSRVRRLLRDLPGQTIGDLGRIAREHLGDARDMVEADERVGDDEAALRKPRAGLRERNRRLQHGDVVVAEVADDGAARRDLLLGLVEGDEPRARAHEAVPAETALLDRLEQKAGAPPGAQPQVGPERGDQVGVDVRRFGHGSTKGPSWRGSTSGAGCEDASALAGDAPAPLAAPSPPGADGRGHLPGA